MTLQASGNISILDIVGEFGGAGTHSLTEYYRGGSFVPDTAPNAGIPTSGSISVTDFYGGQETTLATITVTQGQYVDGGGDWNGYRDSGPGFGSRSPTTLNGATIRGLYHRTETNRFYCELNGTLAQSFFQTINFVGGGLFSSAAATFSTAGGKSTWSWSDASPGTWDGDGTVTVDIEY